MSRKKLFNRVLLFIKNKYFLAVLFLIVWLAFFDRNDLLSQYRLRNKVKELEVEKSYFTSEINKNREDLHDLKTNKASLEKFAREKYLMKREDEDIFVLVEDTVKN